MIKTSFLFNAKQFKKIGIYLIKRLTRSTKKQFSDYPPLPPIRPDALYTFWENFFYAETKSEDFQFFIDNILQYSLHLHHPKAFGHQMAVVSPLIALTEFLSRYLNNASGLFDVGPTANTMEKIVIAELIKRFHFPDSAAGILVSGGSISNLTALLSARQHLKEWDVWTNGNPEKQLAIMVSEHAHYSMSRAVKIMGLGDPGIVLIPTDNRLKIRPETLETLFQQAEKTGKKIFCVVGMAGTTANGSFDDLDAIADFCERHQIWFHVDAAHGGLFGLSETSSTLVKGMNRASSLTLNFHKMGFIPALCSALLFKEKQAMYSTFSQQAPYLTLDAEAPAIIEHTLECTKPALSLSVYTLFKFMRSDEFSTYLTSINSFTKKVAQLIRKNPHFELFSEPECNVLCFRVYDEHEENEVLNAKNEKIYYDLIQEGNFYLTKTKIHQIVYLRVVFINPLTSIKDVRAFLDSVITKLTAGHYEK